MMAKSVARNDLHTWVLKILEKVQKKIIQKDHTLPVLNYIEPIYQQKR